MSLPSSPPTAVLIRRHLLLGWAGLVVVVASGLALESLHAFKIDAYLLVGHDTRRLMWRLAHAHGGVLCLIQLGYAATLRVVPGVRSGSKALTTGTILLPLGFLLGGLGAVGADPSLGVLLVPLGAVALFIGLLQITTELVRAPLRDDDVVGSEPGQDH